MGNELDRRELLKYAWGYFHFHASQRLTTFNFYLVVCGLIIAAYATALKESYDTPVALLLGFVLTLMSFVFWKLDRRNRQMIWNAEEALKELEDKFDLVDRRSPIRIFRYEEDQSASIKRGARLLRFWPRLFTFSVSFGIVFATFAALGIGAVVYAGLKARTGAPAVDKAVSAPAQPAQSDESAKSSGEPPTGASAGPGGG